MATETRLSRAARSLNSPPLLAAALLVPVLGGGWAAAGDLATPTAAVPPRPITGATGGPVQLAQAEAASTAGRSAAAPDRSLTPALGSGATRSAHRGSVGCQIGPERTADIGSPVTAVIAAIRVERGDTVHKGQILALLEQDIEKANWQAAMARSAIDADVRGAEASYALARERHERMSSLVDSGAVAALSIEQARAEQDVALQRLEQARGQQKVTQQELGVARAQLAQRTLKAPFDGVVVERLAHEGERVEERPLLRIAQMDPLRVELVMPAARWGSVQPGEPLVVVPELPGAGKLTATVTHVDRMLDAASNTFRVRLSLPNPGHRVPAGARCKLDGAPDGGSLEAAPRPAPAASAGGSTVWTPGQAAPGARPASWMPGARPAAAPRLQLTI